MLDTVADSFTADVFLTADGTFPLGVAVSADGSRVYATAYGSDVVYVVDATTNLLAGPITLSTAFGSPQPVGLALNGSGTRLYVTEESIDRLAIVDTTTSTEITSLPVGHSPFTVDLTPDGSRAYVVNRGDASSTIVDTASMSAIGTVLTVDDFPASGERFIAPGAEQRSPGGARVFGGGLACQKRLGASFKRFGTKAHVAFASCFGRMPVTSRAARTLGRPRQRASAISTRSWPAPRLRGRLAASGQVLAGCGGVLPDDLALPCDATATTIADTVSCVLDAQIARVTEEMTFEYAGACAHGKQLQPAPSRYDTQASGLSAFLRSSVRSARKRCTVPPNSRQ